MNRKNKISGSAILYNVGTMKKNLLLVVFAVAVLAVGAYLYINSPAGYQATEQDGLTDDSA